MQTAYYYSPRRDELVSSLLSSEPVCREELGRGSSPLYRCPYSSFEVLHPLWACGESRAVRMIQNSVHRVRMNRACSNVQALSGQLGQPFALPRLSISSSPGRTVYDLRHRISAEIFCEKMKSRVTSSPPPLLARSRQHIESQESLMMFQLHSSRPLPDDV